MSTELGFSGRLARRFLHNQITPLLALLAVGLGLFALAITPREEDPQINVTFANVFIPFPGASPRQVASQVTTPMEQVLGEISGVKHIYSESRPGLAVLTVQYEVGQPRNQAIVRLYNAIYSHRDLWPPNAGILPPLIKPMGIDDVPIVALTLWTSDQNRGSYQLGQVAQAIETQLKRVPGTRKVYTIGAPQSIVRVRLEPGRLAAYGLAPGDIARALQAANIVRQAGDVIGSDRVEPVQAGVFLAGRDDVANLVVGVHDGKPVYLTDVADVSGAPDAPQSYVWFGTGAGAAVRHLPKVSYAPAVTIAIAKKSDTNASTIADAVIQRLHELRGTYIPAGVHVTVTRNYGHTADEKAMELIEKLIEATLSVVLLVMLTMGRREAVVVGAAVSVTLMATLFASWAWGFTINRVSLFALIFSIGILVDDAIVVVENVHRHMRLGGGTLSDLIPVAVDEVGGPTILATFTVIAALMPMAFVGGMMGPYMSPIPINASSGMLISLGVALMFTPWLCRKLLGKTHIDPTEHRQQLPLLPLFQRLVGPFLAGPEGRRRRRWLYGGIGAAILVAVSLVVTEAVVLKMLPFDNRSEFQVVVNMPVGTTVESTAHVLDALAQVLARMPEVSDYQVYAGTAGPVNFNGLVRQYYLRSGPRLGEIDVQLVPKSARSLQSHAIAMAVRKKLAQVARRYGAAISVVEIPPGPPVQAPIVAEIYGPSYAEQRQIALAVHKDFEDTAGIVDIDDSVDAPAPRLLLQVERQKAALLGVSQEQIARTLSLALSGYDATYVHIGRERKPIPVRLELSPADQARISKVLALRVRAASGALVPLAALVRVRHKSWEQPIFHRDLLPVTYVTGDMAGRIDSPLYGMFAIAAKLRRHPPAGVHVVQHFVSPPSNPNEFAIKWGGEWQVTYDTFRDMGIAYSVGLALIYLLIVAQFGSYFVPLIIMAPIPLTVIGVLPGHALFGAQFTATSMIGMIALAGIIVRNSILLVDFIDGAVRSGFSLEEAVVRAGATRAKPIALTAVAAMLGAVFILSDPIFNGLAISLLFGVFVSTLLTLVVIPVLYYVYLKRREARTARASAEGAHE
ncbi:MAG: efflux RND transporter permease subunit [Steroidobacteraceae bacterium]